MSRYVLQCLLCAAGQTIEVPDGKSDLVAHQEHLMLTHEVSQDELSKARRVMNQTGNSDVYVWTLPDGRPWLRAERLLGLVKAGFVAGYTPQDLAPALNISFDVLAKLDARAITGESIPSHLLREMAQLTQVSLALVEAYLDAPPADSLFRCGPGSQQPLGKEPFWKSISQSPLLSAQQRAKWLALVDAEGKR
jgi:hypothetical protein